MVQAYLSVPKLEAIRCDVKQVLDDPAKVDVIMDINITDIDCTSLEEDEPDF
jgi:hypothetical protein